MTTVDVQKAGTWRLEVGGYLAAVAGPGGRVDDVLLDRSRLTLTDVVLTPWGLLSMPHLVPAGAIDAAGPRAALTWTTQQVQEAPVIRRSRLVGWGLHVTPDAGDEVGVVDRVAPIPPGIPGPDGGVGWIVVYDAIPAGTVEIRHASPVRTCDGQAVGHVGGLVFDKPGRQLTDVLVERRHWWPHRLVVVPARYVASVETDRITLRMSMDEVAHLSPHDWAVRESRL